MSEQVKRDFAQSAIELQRRVLELVEESQVIFEEQADVGDVVFSHGEPFYAEAEGPAGVSFAVYAYSVEYVRINHAAAAHLDPAFTAGLVL